MVTQTLNVDEFIDLLVEAVDNLTSHSYTSDEGRRKFQKIGDFAEKYTFVVLDENSIVHLSKLYCTLHSIVVYYKENSKLAEKSFCFLTI